jgi:hypothetical protein
MARQKSQLVDITDSGSNDIVIVSGSQSIIVSKIYYNPSSDITGDVIVKLGNRVIGGITNPIGGGNHPLVSFCGNSHEQGEKGENLTIILPTATASKVTFHGEIKP